MQYENRVKILSKSLRLSLGDHFVLINLILSKLDSLEYESIDGGVFVNNFSFDAETEEITFIGRGGPGTRIAKFISKLYPNCKVRIFWVTDSFNSGIAFFRSGESLVI
jgi:hypothetical protein